jgi:hypothetical protein
MVRLSILMLLVIACKKKEEPAPDPMPVGEAPRGHSVTKIKGSGAEEAADPTADAAQGRFEQLGSAGEAKAVDNNVVAKDAKLDAGVDAPKADKSAAYMDDEGRIHGPGGPVFMGRGADCDATRDHCLREGVWFAVGNLVAGKLYRATPIFEYEKKWYNWRGKEEPFAMRFKTKVGTRETIKAGDPIIWFIDENSSHKFVDNEYDALTSSRWEAGVVESVSTDKIRVKGWTYGAVPIDTTRVIVERKDAGTSK